MTLSPRESALLSDAVEAAAYADLFAAAPPPLHQHLGLRVAQVADATLLLAPGLPTPLFNRAIGLGQQQVVSDADLDAVLAAYRGAGSTTWWLHVNPVTAPADLAARLLDHGYTQPARGRWAKMLRASAAPPLVPEPTRLQVAPARADDVAATAQAIASAFEMPPFMPGWIAALHGRPRWRLYSVRDGSQVVGGGCLFVDDRCGWLGMGAVLATHRRRGGQAALMALRIADAAAAGAPWVATETGEPLEGEHNPSLANMRRAGFIQVASRLNFAGPPAGA